MNDTNTTTKPGVLEVMDADIAATQRRIDRGEVPVSHYDVLNEKREARATVERLAEAAASALRRAEFEQGPDAGNDGMVRSLRAAIAAFRGEA